VRISTILTPSPLYLKGPEATLVAKLPWRAVLHLPQGLGPSLIESVASSPGTRRFGHQSIHASGVEVVDGVTHRLLAASEVRRYLGTSSPLEEARSICERRRVKVSLERYPASRISRSLSENERTKIGAFMATTVTHNPKSMLKMHLFQEGNIRLMKAEIDLEGTSAGGCVRVCTRVH